MVSGTTFDAIPQRWITRIEWFQVLVRTDDLCLPMSKKMLKTVEYFFLEMGLEIYICWILTKLHWFCSHFIVRPTIINRFLLVFQYKYVRKIPNIWIIKMFFKFISSKKYSAVFNVFLFIVKQRSSVLTSTWNHSIRLIHRWGIIPNYEEFKVL